MDWFKKMVLKTRPNLSYGKISLLGLIHEMDNLWPLLWGMMRNVIAPPGEFPITNQDVEQDGSGRVLFISPLKLSDHVWLLREIWGNGGKLVEVASPKWGSLPVQVVVSSLFLKRCFTPKTRCR